MGNMMIFGENMKAVDRMKDADAGKLFKALLHHVNEEEPDGLPYAVQAVYDLLAGQIDRSAEKWEELRQKRSDAGRKGAEVTNRQKAAKNGKIQQSTTTLGKGRLPNPNPNPNPVKKNSFFDFDQRTNVDLDGIVREAL